jgi:hypothetical protein
LSFMPCRNGTAGHPSAGSSQLLPEPTTALGPFLPLTTVPYGYIPFPTPLLQCSHRFHCGLFLRDTLMLRLRLYFFWGWLLTLQTGIRHFLAGQSLFLPCPHFC